MSPGTHGKTPPVSGYVPQERNRFVRRQFRQIDLFIVIGDQPGQKHIERFFLRR
jgi:hypothetical protein